MERSGRPILKISRNSPSATKASAISAGMANDSPPRPAMAATANSPVPAPPQRKLPAAFQFQCGWCQGSTPWLRIFPGCSLYSCRRCARRGRIGIAGLGVEIKEARLGAELAVHAKMLLLAQQPRHVAVRIVDIAEVQRVGNAGIDAGRRRARLEPRRQAVREAEVDAVRAERAFLRHAEARGCLRARSRFASPRRKRSSARSPGIEPGTDRRPRNRRSRCRDRSRW